MDKRESDAHINSYKYRFNDPKLELMKLKRRDCVLGGYRDVDIAKDGKSQLDGTKDR